MTRPDSTMNKVSLWSPSWISSMVCAARSSRAEESWSKRIGTWLFYRLDEHYEWLGAMDAPELRMDREGYRNLCRLVSAGYREGFHYKPRVDKDLLRELNGGLIAFSGCLRGEVPHALLQGQFEKARGAAEELAAIFDGRYYIEIQDNRLEKQEQVNVELKALAKRMPPSGDRRRRPPSRSSAIPTPVSPR